MNHRRDDRHDSCSRFEMEDESRSSGQSEEERAGKNDSRLTDSSSLFQFLCPRIKIEVTTYH